MLSKKILKSVLFATAVLALPLSANASGTSDATVNIKEGTKPEPSGELRFVDVTKNAKIQFAETQLTGATLTAKEATLGAAKILIEDTRKDVGTTETGYTVLVKDVTPTTEVNSFFKHNLVLALASANVSGGGNHTHTPVTVNQATAKPVFTGKNEVGVINKSVSLNPTLTIPGAMEQAGNFKATLEWTLAIEVD